MIEVLPEIRRLLAEERLNELGSGKPNLGVRVQLQQLAQDLLAKAKDRDFALACVAGLWLYHDFFDESHSIIQDLPTLEGSYWHGILHRREPDYWNAKYWFRRVPGHPIHEELCKDAVSLAKDARVDEFARQKKWDASAFVDCCEKAASGPERLTLLCRRIQRREWELLFHFCHGRAFG